MGHRLARGRARYARAHGLPVQQTASDLYSRDGNLWHLSHEGGRSRIRERAAESDVPLTAGPSASPRRPRR
jgi:argininosuccinate synthase